MKGVVQNRPLLFPVHFATDNTPATEKAIDIFTFYSHIFIISAWHIGHGEVSRFPLDDDVKGGFELRLVHARKHRARMRRLHLARDDVSEEGWHISIFTNSAFIPLRAKISQMEQKK